MTELNPAEIDSTFKRDINFCTNTSKEDLPCLHDHLTGSVTCARPPHEHSPEGRRRSISCSSSEWSSEEEEGEGTQIVEPPKPISTTSITRGVQEGDTGEDQEFNEPSNGGDCQNSQETEKRGNPLQRVTPPAPEEFKSRQRCSKCGADISSLHYLEQVKHAKQCINRRKGDGEVVRARRQNQSGLLSKDIRDWLKVSLGIVRVI